jgi:endonuclease/exonuclease/phosphatase family metal-dependent hydrolase
MLLDRARRALSQLKARPAGFSLVREGEQRSQHHHNEVAVPQKTLRLLTFNVQAGIGSQRYSDYITGSWKHLVAHSRSLQNIELMANVVRNFDVVALQEVDGGSLRSRNVNQLAHMATLGDFGYHHQQLNRNLGRLGQFSNGLLSRLTPYKIEDHRLPGLPGRGAIIAHYGHPDAPLVIAGVHLSLGEKYRNIQLDYLAGQLHRYKHVAMLGDFNCRLDHLQHSPIVGLGLHSPETGLFTFPSWAPDRHIDHILLSKSLSSVRTEVLDGCKLSDHLPLATEILLPDDVLEAAQLQPPAIINQAL